METILKLQDLTYTYPDGTHALAGVSLEIQRGEKIAVLGANGSGKSTLFLCLNGVLHPQGGQIFFNEAPISYDKKGLIQIRKNVGIVFQDPETQLFCVDVYQEVAFGPQNLGYSKEQVHACVEKSLATMDIAQLRDKPPHFLSGGQKKRVTVAAVLAMSPQILLFDEPTAALDPAHARQLMGEINALCAQGITILMATHDVNTAYEWADRIVVLRDGAICAVGAPAQVLGDAELLHSTELQMPFVLRLYRKLCAAGLLQAAASPPTSMAELEERIG